MMLKRCLLLFLKYYNSLFLFSLPLFILYFLIIWQFPAFSSTAIEAPLSGSLFLVLILLLFFRFIITYFVLRYIWFRIQDDTELKSEPFSKGLYRLIRFFINLLLFSFISILWFSVIAILGILLFIPNFPWNNPSVSLWTQTIQKASETVSLGFDWIILIGSFLWILFLLIPWFLSQINLAVQKDDGILTSWKQGFRLVKGNRIKICSFYVQIACLELLLFLVLYAAAFGLTTWINDLRGVAMLSDESSIMQMTSVLSGLITIPLVFATHLSMYKTLKDSK